jgi:hypothetical protein
LVRYHFFKDFFKKNPNAPKNKASIVAFLQTAAERWESLSDADKAPYVARSLALRREHKKATSVKGKQLGGHFGQPENVKIDGQGSAPGGFRCRFAFNVQILWLSDCSTIP